MIVDAHHHLWAYNEAEYRWIDDSMRRLKADFLTEELRSIARASGVQRFVTVQARQTIEETLWLLQQAQSSELIAGVVGWLPLAEEWVERTLDKINDPRLVGLRHVVQDEPDPAFLLRDDFNRGVSLLASRGLTYDLLILERQLASAIKFADRHPQLTIVLDHIAKPRIAAGEIEPWKTQLNELAQRPHVVCKVSGLVTEATWSSWSAESIAPYLDTVLEAFGPSRLLFGSDWPVCLLACEYDEWKATVEAWASDLSPAEQRALFGENATRVYGLTGGTAAG